MIFLVFAQEAHPLEGIVRVVTAARVYFGAEATVDERREAPHGASSRIVFTTGDEVQIARIVARAATPSDFEAARVREARSGGGGLAQLAGRCSFVWEVDVERADAHAYRVAAMLAAGLLGPVLTDDAIFGVRGARARAEG